MPINPKLSILAAIALALSGIAACNSDPATDSSSQVTADDEPILTIKQSGGCVRMGPNCAIHTLYEDGRVEVARNTFDNSNALPIAETTGTIDSGQVQSWQLVVENEDFDALRSSLPEGRCAGCVDGVDFEYIITTANQTIRFSSIDHEFDLSYTFFSITADLYRKMSSVAPLEVRRR